MAEKKRNDQLLSPAEAISSRSAVLKVGGGDIDLTTYGVENHVGTDGATTNGGTTLTSAAGGIPTDGTYGPANGSKLYILSGAQAGQVFDVASVTATTIVISGATFVGALSNQQFRLSKSPGYLAPFARMIVVGGAGNVYTKEITDVAEGATSFRKHAVQAGQVLIGAFVAVASTTNGTTATDLVVKQ